MNHLVHRTVSVAACGAAVVLCATTASSAPDEPSVCEADYIAYGKALEAENAGHLRQARNVLTDCARSRCRQLASQCRRRHELLGLEMSSIIPVVTDERGVPQVDVKVTIDGELLTSHLDGLGVPVEPGMHEFSFSVDGGDGRVRVFETEKLMILVGQRNRIISVKLAAAPPDQVAPDKVAPEKPAPDKAAREEAPPPVESPHASAKGEWALPRSPVPYILGSVGVAAVTGAALTTYWGNKDNSALDSRCSPNCLPSSQDHIKTLYLASDISFGVGLAALGVTTWLFASSRSAEKAPAPSAAVTTFDVQPTRSGAYASFAGAF